MRPDRGPASYMTHGRPALIHSGAPSRKGDPGQRQRSHRASSAAAVRRSSQAGRAPTMAVGMSEGEAVNSWSCAPNTEPGGDLPAQRRLATTRPCAAAARCEGRSCTPPVAANGGWQRRPAAYEHPRRLRTPASEQGAWDPGRCMLRSHRGAAPGRTRQGQRTAPPRTRGRSRRQRRRRWLQRRAISATVGQAAPIQQRRRNPEELRSAASTPRCRIPSSETRQPPLRGQFRRYRTRDQARGLLRARAGRGLQRNSSGAQ